MRDLLSDVSDADLLSEQIAYYRARAREYDEWWERKGQSDRGPEANARWFAEVDAAYGALDEFAPRGSVLELACGTGIWTQRLLAHATSITGVDVSDEVVEVNRERVGEGRVRYVLADLFSWEPDARYDVVFFGFWLSHVPAARFDEFWDMVAKACAPDGRVYFIDNYWREHGPVPVKPLVGVDYGPDDLDSQVTNRRLNDGRAFRAVKVWWRPEDLEARLRDLGWDVAVRTTGDFFYIGQGSRA